MAITVITFIMNIYKHNILTLKTAHYWLLRFVCEWVSDCCLTPNVQCSAISWREQVTFDEMMMPLSSFLDTASLAEKQQIPNIYFFIWSERSSNTQSTAIEASTVTTTQWCDYASVVHRVNKNETLIISDVTESSWFCQIRQSCATIFLITVIIM